VPLLMALKQEVVRLLIADDVGIGKTIEAALIARELIDRGEIGRLTVLCPPHLCEQWQRELQQRFHIHAVVVRSTPLPASSAACRPTSRSSRPTPIHVVSLDYIKSDRRRDEFQRACPECVIVDEAHTCTFSGQGRQQRYACSRAGRKPGPPHDPAHGHPALGRRGSLLQPARPAAPVVP
jgi:SNF2 family DNA or RNA helicase